MFAGVTMRQENVLCFEYGLLGNVDRGRYFHIIMVLHRAAMSAINAMNKASQFTEFQGDIREQQSFSRRRRWL